MRILKPLEKLRAIPPFEFENWGVIALGGIPSKGQVGDMGIDGCIFPVSAALREIDAFFHKSGKVIVRLRVSEILDEELGKRVGSGRMTSGEHCRDGSGTRWLPGAVVAERGGTSHNTATSARDACTMSVVRACGEWNGLWFMVLEIVRRGQRWVSFFLRSRR